MEINVEINLEVAGLAELEKKLLELERSVGLKVLRGALMDAAAPIHKDIKANAPIGSKPQRRKVKGKGFEVQEPGRLRKGVKRKSRVNSNGSRRGFSGAAMARVQVGVFGAYYAYYGEMGTAHQPAKPFIRPAFERNKFKAVDIFRDKLKKRIKKVTR